MPDFAKTVIASPEWRLLSALAIGLLIGTERERRKGEGATRAAEGMRTFALVSLLGGIGAQTGSTALVVLAGTFVAFAALIGYWLGDRHDPGLTTEVTLMVAFLLGVLAQSQTMLAVASGVVVSALLAIRDPLHRFVREILTEEELQEGLIFGISALVILPFLPNRPIDPLGVINPFAVWRLAVVLMGLSAAGYCALRILGPRYGLVIAGFTFGFVSSTASIAAMGGRARDNIQLSAPGAAGAMASVLGSLTYLLSLVATADLDVLWLLLPPGGLALALTLAYCVFLAWRHSAPEFSRTLVGHAFDLKMVTTFAGLVIVFSLLSTAVVAWFGEAGMLASAAAIGLIDVHAASVSVAALVTSAKIDRSEGAIAILAALSANIAAKIPTAFLVGARQFAFRVAAGLVLLLVGLWGGFAWEVLNTKIG